MISSRTRKIPRTLAFFALTLAWSLIVLAQDAASPAPARTDGQIEMDAVHALDGAPQLKNDLVTVATIQGEVTLSGTVASQADKDLAESLVKQVAGVAKVQNNLAVGDPQQASTEPQMAPEADQTDFDNPPAPAEPPVAANPQPAPTPSQPPVPGRRLYAHQQDPNYPSRPAYKMPTGPITVTQGSNLILRTVSPVGTKNAKEGTLVDFTLVQDVTVGGLLAIPRGATFHGVVTESKEAGKLSGSPELTLKLTSLDLGGQNYPVVSDDFLVKGPNKTGHTVGSALTGGLIGTIIGCAAGRGVGCAVGAGAGVAAGTAVSAASSGPGVWIPAEARVDFHLTQPVTVNPVTAEEAGRLAQGLYPGGPTLYRRGPAPYPYAGPYYAGYPYGYPPPPVYFQPYYTVGVYHYWR
jgi:hypothetical protein